MGDFSRQRKSSFGGPNKAQAYAPCHCNVVMLGQSENFLLLYPQWIRIQGGGNSRIVLRLLQRIENTQRDKVRNFELYSSRDRLGRGRTRAREAS